MSLPRLVLAAVLLLIGACSMAQSSAGRKSAARAPVRIRNVVFKNAALLSAEDRREISKVAREDAAHAIDIHEELGDLDEAHAVSGYADEAGERVRAAYQNQGYFKVDVAATSLPVGISSRTLYDIVVRVIDSGIQYRLGDLRIIHMRTFPESQLRDLFPLQSGDVFRRDRIAKGLENLRRLYGEQGYLNFTAVPQTEFDEDTSTAYLSVDVDEGQQFQWGDLHVDGMRVQDSEIVLRAWAGLKGQTYSGRQDLDRFLGKFFYPLRKHSSLADLATLKMDGKDGVVDVYLSLFFDPNIKAPAAKAPTGHR